MIFELLLLHLLQPTEDGHPVLPYTGETSYNFIMQSYLFLGKNNINRALSFFIKDKKLNRLDYELKTIEDVRHLNKLVSLTRKNTAFVIKNIDNASEEALNAFLKNLEEPQENLYFLLTASNSKGLLPTVVSRCQIVKIKGTFKLENKNLYEEFANAKRSEKLKFLSEIKIRDDAIDFLENFLIYLHGELSNNSDIKKNADNISATLNTLSNVKANGNVVLQLTNLVIKLV